jgi:hypothetical protein
MPGLAQGPVDSLSNPKCAKLQVKHTFSNAFQTDMLLWIPNRVNGSVTSVFQHSCTQQSIHSLTVLTEDK